MVSTREALVRVRESREHPPPLVQDSTRDVSSIGLSRSRSRLTGVSYYKAAVPGSYRSKLMAKRASSIHTSISHICK